MFRTSGHFGGSLGKKEQPPEKLAETDAGFEVSMVEFADFGLPDT